MISEILKKNSKLAIGIIFFTNFISFVGTLAVYYLDRDLLVRNFMGFIITITILSNYIAGNYLVEQTNKASVKGRFINTIYDLYILYSIYAYLSLLGITYTRVLNAIAGFSALFLVAMVFSVFVFCLRNTDAFAPSNDIPLMRFEVILRRMLKIILFLLYLILFIIVGSVVFRTSNVVSYGSGMLISAASWVIFLVFIGIGQITLRINPKAEKPKKRRNLVVLGTIIAIIFIMPLAAIPRTIYLTNQDFQTEFGEDWNQIPSEIQGFFLETPFDLSAPYFGIGIKDNYDTKEEILYKNSTEFQLYYDVHYPKVNGPGSNRTIIYIHGGGWTTGARTDGGHLKAYFANQGYVVFSIDYRLVDTSLLGIREELGLNISIQSAEETAYKSGPFGIRDMVEDIGDFTHHLASLSYAYGADLSKVTILGQSAGAYLAGIVGFGYNNTWFQGNFSSELNIESIILYYPPDDAEAFFYHAHPFYSAQFQMIEGSPESNPDTYFHYTPSNLIDENSPPCLLIHGMMDTLVPYENSLRIYRKYKEYENTCLLVSHPFVGHALTHSTQYQPINIYYLERFLHQIPLF